MHCKCQHRQLVDCNIIQNLQAAAVYVASYKIVIHCTVAMSGAMHVF